VRWEVPHAARRQAVGQVWINEEGRLQSRAASVAGGGQSGAGVCPEEGPAPAARVARAAAARGAHALRSGKAVQLKMPAGGVAQVSTAAQPNL